MTRHSFFIFSILSTILLSCNYSKGVKKDLTTGLTVSYNGFAIEDIYLADESGERLKDNQVVLGSKIAIIATGVDYFATKDDRAYPGCRIVLTDKNNKEVLSLADAFSDMADGTPEAEARTLQASLNTGDPMLSGETYHLSVLFFDKQKKENEIKADVELLMK